MQSSEEHFIIKLRLKLMEIAIKTKTKIQEF